MPETGPTQPQLFPDDAVTGTGQPLGEWPITAQTVTETPALGATPQAEQLPFDNDTMRWAA